MTSQAGESEPETLFDRWQKEQQSWQRLVIDYVDKAATDETFLTNLGNAMRGSLLANKPYPGTSAGGGEVRRDPERSELDEVVFAVRRVEGQILDLTMAVEKLAASLTPDDTSASDRPAAHGSAPTSD
jgi:hypothetical protein